MDIFGFKNQGINYEKFRPIYPSKFITHCLSILKNKNRYLDIATGTGQLLFAIAPHFLSSKGVDISQKMITTAQEKVERFSEKHPESKIQLEVQGVMEIKNDQKYDLITVGQALHFFPIKDSLRKIKTLLREDGVFVTFGYIPTTVQSSNPLQGNLYNMFYKKIKPLFTFDCDDLFTYYADKEKYPFEDIFSKVQRQVIEVPLKMNKLEYISYIRTFSGYNLYLEKHGEDPLLEVENNCADEITMLFDYFRIQCTP